MQRRLLLLVCAVLTTVGLWHINAQSASSSSSAAAAQQQYVEGVVRVKLQPEVAARIEAANLPMSVKSTQQQYVKTGVTALDRANQRVKAVSMTRVFPYAGKDEAKHKAFGLDLWYDVAYEASGMTPAQVRNIYSQTGGVAHAQRVPVYQPVGGEKFRTLSASELAAATAQAASMTNLPFNDPLLASQWHYNNDGRINGTLPGADANIFKAWNSGVTGSKDVIVAIIDGGFQIDHPDLKDNLWINEKELNGQPGVDDDGDGYVDDVYGYNFVINSADLSAHSHGTHVAGTVGATNGNGLGVCGVAGGTGGNGGVKMMVCQVFDSRASSSLTGDFAAALVYAADRGASIAQCSWGMSAADIEDEAVTAAVYYFTVNGGGDNMSGGLCIFAAGNNGENGRYYPGCLDEVVAVGAMASDGTVASYSNYGPWVDVTAPGGLMDYGQQYGVLSTLPNSSYGYNEGTSMACPHVSGIAALILSKYGNKNFSNETLRTLLTTSVNDLYSLNPSYEGLMGSGYIDAYKALQGDEGDAPEAVGDFALTASHDNILIEWTIPASGDGTIDHHVVYYSTSPFDASTDLSTLSRATADTKFYNCGDNTSYELTGLRANTQYYIALVAYNRWGKASAMSAVKTATTNAGPVAAFSTGSVNISIDASKSAVGSGSFDISNTGEGVLKYSLSASTVNAAYMSTYGVDGKPVPGRLVPFTGHINPMSVSQGTVVSAEYDADEWPATLTYSKYLFANIGETDTELPNAMAQYFYVDKDAYPDGFNLSHIRLGGYYGKNPTIEIYEGSRTISAATLLQTVNYDYFNYRTDIALNEQICFAPGSGFWVVVKFAAGQTNPLGAGLMLDDVDVPQYSFYSCDDGATWTQLNVVLAESSFASHADRMTWDMYAISKNPDWSATLNPDPASGEVRAGQSQTVALTTDGQKLVNGTYTYRLKATTNEAEPSGASTDVVVNVTGYHPELTSAKLVDFGNLLVGQAKTLEVQLVNVGYGDFKGRWGGLYGDNVTSSSDQFDVSEGANAIAARSTSSMNVTFRPTKAGNFSSNITLTASSGDKYTFTVCGVAIDPAHVAVDPQSVDLGNLEVGGESKSVDVTVSNTGKYPLQYIFPKFSDASIEGVETPAHKFGYTYIANFNDEAVDYEPMPELADEIDITGKLSESNWQFEVPVGFKFPFYGQDYETAYICLTGGVSMNKITGRIPSMVPTASSCNGLGYISGFATSGYLGIGSDTKISYGHKDGKLVVKYSNTIVYMPYGEGTTQVSFHMVLNPNGDVNVYYDNYTPEMVFDWGRCIFVGVVDADVNDPFVVTDADSEENGNNVYSNFMTGAAVKIVAPAKSMIESVSSTDGYIGIGESAQITVTAKAVEGLDAGQLVNNLVMLTNDPDRASVNIVVSANIVGDNLAPLPSIAATEIDFGSVFRTSAQSRSVLLRNEGHDVLHVTSVAVKDGKMTVDAQIAAGFEVAAGDLKDITVTLPTDTEGAVSDVLVITYADGTTTEIQLKGVVIGVPTIEVQPDVISLTTEYGTPVTQTVTLVNGGDEPLQVTVAPDDWFSFTDLEADDVNTSVDYTFKSLSDGQDVTYDWIDITGDYTDHMPFSYFIETTDFKEVTLPFDFPFYGENYKKMYIYNTGFVSFDEPAEDYKQFPEPPEAGIPTTETFYTNIICPFWGNHSMDTSSTSGVYYKDCGDHVIVTYVNYGNSVMTGMNFQVILFPDGTFKFQYKIAEDETFVSAFGVVGVMNHGGTRGLSLDKSFINNGNAVMLYPSKSFTVAPSSSTGFDISVKADQLADYYSHELALTTNVPSAEKVNIPVYLEITGEPVPVFPEAVNFETVKTDDFYAEAYVDFEVANNGSQAFAIDAVINEDIIGNMGSLLVWADPYAGGGGGIDPGPLSTQADESNMTWVEFVPGFSQPVVVGKEPAKFRIALWELSQVFSYTGELQFYVEGLPEEMYTSPLTVNITEAPVLTFSSDELRLGTKPDNYQGTASVEMSNTGLYTLKYSLSLDPSGNDASAEEDADNGGIAPAFAPAECNVVVKSVEKAVAVPALEATVKACDTKALSRALSAAKVKDDQQFIYDVPVDQDGKPLSDRYNMLYYPVLNPVSSAQAAIMGSGSGALDENFYAATRYEAPEEGFNLTHLYFVGTVGDLENVDIEATVVLGSNVAAKNMNIGHGTIHVDKEEPNSAGNYMCVPRMLEFDKPVYINPCDTFYVVLKYPAGYSGAAMVASKDGEMTPNRYMAHLKAFGGWFDLEQTFDDYYNYGAFGYFMTCVEHTKGQPWIKLLNEETSGTLEVGEKLDLNFEINAAAAYFEKENKATLVVTSNDPTVPVCNYHIYLDKNAAPVVALPSGNITVPEASSITVPVTVADAEGDAFTVSIVDDINIATVASYANAQGSQDGITLADGVYSVEAGTTLCLNVAIAPDYGTAGSHTLTVNASDAQGNNRSEVLDYIIEHVNRAPEYIGPDVIKVVKGQASQTILFSDLFDDPDGDELTVTVGLKNTSLVNVFTSETGLIIVAGDNCGSTRLSLQAVDSEDAATVQTVTVQVVEADGIDDVTADESGITISGDPASGAFGVKIADGADLASLSVYNNAGQLLALQTAKNVAAGDTVTVSVGHLTAGVYHLVADIDGALTSVKFVLN